MIRRAQLKDLASPRFLREIHHVLWIEPTLLGTTVDAGWNCRDHAWLTAIIARLLGHRSALVHGEACFVNARGGPRGASRFRQNPHTWIHVDGVGAVDLSIRPQFTVAGDEYRMAFKCLFAGDCLPRGRGRACVLENPDLYASVVESPSSTGPVAAVYLLREAEEVHQGLLSRAAGWIRSPLAERLGARYGNPSDLYCALLLHLCDFLGRTATSLAGLSFDDAWSQLAKTRHGAIERAGQLLEAAARPGSGMPERSAPDRGYAPAQAAS